MSERLNSVDIEDVLSSIRRLVSDDARPAAKVATPPAAPDPQADKLILTPALRIAPEPEPEPDPAIEAEAALEEQADLATAPQGVEPEMAEPVMAFHSIRPERGAARLEAVMGQVAQGLESGPGDWETAAEPPSRFESDWTTAEEELAAAMAENPEAPPPDHTPFDLPPFDAMPETDGPVAPAPLWSVPSAEVPLVDPLTAFEASAAGQSAIVTLAEVDVFTASAPDGDDPYLLGPDMQASSNAVPEVSDRIGADQGDDWPEQDWAATGEPDPVDRSSDMPETAAVTIDSPPVALAEEPAMTDKDDPADLPDWARMEVEPVDPAPAQPEAPQPRMADDFRWADAAEAEIRRELEDAVEPQVFAHFAEEDDLDARPFDEDMLRDLVRDIIREELQGALGERITRNVRKLVRAEIARALAVRDFE